MNLIDKYIHTVVNQLPESQRDDVGKELKSNILDMLSDDPTDDEIRTVLESMGDPALMADGYRGEPRYLIGPRFYNDYIKTLKMIVPIVTVVVLALMLFEKFISLGTPNTLDAFIIILTTTLSALISTPITVIAWVTLGFAIAEYTGVKKSKTWHVSDLEAQADPINKPFPMSEIVAEIGFSIFFLLMFFNFAEYIGVYRTVDGHLTLIEPLFNMNYLPNLLPLFIILTIIVVGNALVKLKVRRWTKPLLIANITIEILSSLTFLYIFLFTPFINHRVYSAILPPSVDNSQLRNLMITVPGIVSAWVVFFMFYNSYKYYKEYKAQAFVTY